jgi:hydroxymethylbilane synthase
LRLGTRGSALALAQARWVAAQLGEVSIVEITTAGDLQRAYPASPVPGRLRRGAPAGDPGDKSRWTGALERALLDGEIDIAVHSAKDVPGELAAGTSIVAVPPREDPRDVVVGSLPRGARVGTSSLRRRAQLLAWRPDLEVVELRGNVDTRLRKLEAGEVDATLLALAGLKRLGLADKATALLDAQEFLPAVGQGAITIEARVDDGATRALLAKVDHADTSVALACERAFLAVLDGSCRTPIAGHAVLTADAISFRGMILRPDGSEAFETSRAGSRRDATALGADAGAELKRRAPADFFS